LHLYDFITFPSSFPGGISGPLLLRNFRQEGAGMGGHKQAVDIVPIYAQVKRYFYFVNEGEKQKRIDILIFLPDGILVLGEPQTPAIIVGMNKGGEEEMTKSLPLDKFMNFFEGYGGVGGIIQFGYGLRGIEKTVYMFFQGGECFLGVFDGRLQFKTGVFKGIHIIFNMIVKIECRRLRIKNKYLVDKGFGKSSRHIETSLPQVYAKIKGYTKNSGPGEPWNSPGF
jgi:hypothetical protein